jgi:CDP-diacylglycerol--glycerol-3-phosphate 3-phosphatidyltransferase
MLRIFFVPYFLIFLLYGYRYGKIIAFFIFVAASLTDYFDGRIARKRGEVTDFGKIMDPIADKLLVLSAFISFIQLDIVPTWMVIVMIAREFMITSFRMVALSKGQVLAAIPSGKHKTVWHITTIITILFILALQNWLNTKVMPWKEFFMRMGEPGDIITAAMNVLPYTMALICVIYSVFSAVDFVGKNKEAIFK